jgi:hypothetical protein
MPPITDTRRMRMVGPPLGGTWFDHALIVKA